MPHAETAPRKDTAADRPSFLGRGILILLAGLYLSLFGIAGWLGVSFVRDHAFLLDNDILYFSSLDGYLQPGIRLDERFLVWPDYYDGREPQYGDIAVFFSEEDSDSIYVTRIIGLPDDLMQTVQGVLHINGVPIEREEIRVRAVSHPDDPNRSVTVTEYKEHLPNGRSHLIWEENGEGLFDKASLTLVPQGHVLGLDDYRDNWFGNESAKVGILVPIEQLHHRVEAILWSDDWSRIGLRLYDER